VDFDPDSNPVTSIDQALEILRKKLKRWKRNIPCFGEPTGTIINYSPDRAVRFDLDGQPVEIFDAAYRLGRASLTIRRRECSAVQLRAVFLGGASR
jgi:hypothetical protein